MAKALIIIAKEGYQDVELDGTRKALEDANFSITLASTETGLCTGKFGGTEQATIALSDVDPGDYDRIAFIGGPGASALRDNDDAMRIARETVDADIALGAICIAPTILANAGVLKGKRATVWNLNGEESGYLTAHGAIYVDEGVVTDGMIVTGNGPDVAEEFGQALCNL